MRQTSKYGVGQVKISCCNEGYLPVSEIAGVRGHEVGKSRPENAQRRPRGVRVMMRGRQSTSTFGSIKRKRERESGGVRRAVAAK